MEKIFKKILINFNLRLLNLIGLVLSNGPKNSILDFFIFRNLGLKPKKNQI